MNIDRWKRFVGESVNHLGGAVISGEKWDSFELPTKYRKDFPVITHLTLTSDRKVARIYDIQCYGVGSDLCSYLLEYAQNRGNLLIIKIKRETFKKDNLPISFKTTNCDYQFTETSTSTKMPLMVFLIRVKIGTQRGRSAKEHLMLIVLKTDDYQVLENVYDNNLSPIIDSNFVEEILAKSDWKVSSSLEILKEIDISHIKTSLYHSLERTLPCLDFVRNYSNIIEEDIEDEKARVNFFIEGLKNDSLKRLERLKNSQSSIEARINGIKRSLDLKKSRRIHKLTNKRWKNTTQIQKDQAMISRLENEIDRSLYSPQGKSSTRASKRSDIERIERRISFKESETRIIDNKLNSIKQNKDTTKELDQLNVKIQIINDDIVQYSGEHRMEIEKLEAERRKRSHLVESNNQVDITVIPESCLVILNAFRNDIFILSNKYNHATLTIQSIPELGISVPLICHSCNTPTDAPVLCAEGHIACEICATKCFTCPKYYCNTCLSSLAECWVCKDRICGECSTECEKCHQKLCQDHIHTCTDCGVELCLFCKENCTVCQKSFCRSDVDKCIECKSFTCKEHLVKCSFCKGKFCKQHTIICDICKQVFCFKHSVTCNDDTPPRDICSKHSTSCTLCMRGLCENHTHTCATCNLNFCSDHINSCSGCGKGYCNKHLVICAQENCTNLICEDDTQICTDCHSKFCADHVDKCLSCGETYAKIHMKRCGECTGWLCDNDRDTCLTCDQILCKDHKEDCSVCKSSICSQHTIKCQICNENVCHLHGTSCPNCYNSACLDHLTQCGFCGQIICHECMKQSKVCPACKTFISVIPSLNLSNLFPKYKSWLRSCNNQVCLYLGYTAFKAVLIIVDKSSNRITEKRELSRRIALRLRLGRFDAAKHGILE